MDAKIKGLAVAGIIAGLLLSMKKEPGDDSSGSGSKFNPFATVSGGMAGGGGGAPDVTYNTYNIPAPVFPEITAPSFSSSSAPTKKEINSGQSTTTNYKNVPNVNTPLQAIAPIDKTGLPAIDKFGLPALPQSIAPYVSQPTKKDEKMSASPDVLKLPDSISPYVK